MMRFFCLLFLAGLFVNSQAQKIVFTIDTFSTSFVLVDQYTDPQPVLGHIKNNTANDEVVFWKVTELSIDSAWTVGFCDFNNCYFFNTGQSPAIIYGLHQFHERAGQDSIIDFRMSPYCMAGTGVMKINVWLGSDSAGSARSVEYDMNITGSCLSAVKTISAANNIKVYPTVTHTDLSIDGLNDLKNVKATVYDVLGNVVAQNYFEQPGDHVTLNTSSLYSGVYLVSIESNGNRIVTKRIQKLN